MVTKDLGMVTAYAYAVAGGYTGTEAQFEQLMADLAIVVDDFDNFSVTVTTLPAGSSATASYSNGVLSLGIPKGDKGDTGNTGATGATPQLSIGTVETTAEPSVTITGTVDNPVLNFGLVKGDKGDTGEVSEAELTQAFEDFSANGTVANAEQLTTDIRANDQTPYLFRTAGGSVDIGDREYINGIVGGTIAWNQLVANSGSVSVTVPSGHKYFSNIGDTKAIAISNGSAISATGGTDNIFDLTQMFGSTIADYIYSLEQANAGAGVAWFRKLFPKPYYAYNSGELKSVKGLVSHDMVGFNAFDLASGKAKVVGGHQYEIVGTYTSLSLDGETITPSSGKFTPSKDGELTVVGGNSTTCVHLVWDGSEDGNYEPYQKWSYPLDSDLELRGIPKLDASNNLYYDGDMYESDGTVTRKYGIVDLGTLNWALGNDTAVRQMFYATLSDIKVLPSITAVPNMVSTKFKAVSTADTWVPYVISQGTSTSISICVNPSQYADAAAFKSAMSGEMLVYELATPTTETADPYTSPQIVNDFGTEEFVISNTVAVPIPVGHNTDYPVNLKAKVEMAPDSPSGGNGDYIVRQTNGVNEYVSIANNATIQNILARIEALEG